MKTFHTLYINVYIILVTGIARSITPGQSLRSIFPISNQTKDAQVLKLFYWI